MPDFLEDYKSYYRLRMERYEGNPGYPNSYQSEKAIYEAIASCEVLEEFKDKLGNLNEKNASALIIDQYTIRLKHYEAIKEPIRAEGCKRIIEKATGNKNVSELLTMVNEEENRTSLEVTADTISPFNDLGYMERIEIWEKADIPEKYKEQYRKYAEEEMSNLRKTYTDSEKAISNWKPGWIFDYSRIHEVRHRRLLPIPDEVIDQYIQSIKAIRHAG